MNKGTTDMAQAIFSLTPSEQQAKWDDIMGQMCVFVYETNADIDMAYDWVCEMLNISGFVENETAWDSFYDTFTLAVSNWSSKVTLTHFSFLTMLYTNPAGRHYYFPESISREEALERMKQYAKKAEQNERSGQQLFDDMFGG